MNHQTEISIQPQTASFSELYALIAHWRAKNTPLPRRFEMSTATRRVIEAQLQTQFKPALSNVSSLWGVELVMNESLPLNAIKPIYQ